MGETKEIEKGPDLDLAKEEKEKKRIVAEVEVVDQVRKTRALREVKERPEQVLALVARVDPLAVVQVDPLQVVVLQAPIRLDQDQGVKKIRGKSPKKKNQGQENQSPN